MNTSRPREEVTDDGDGHAAGSMLLMRCNADVVRHRVHGDVGTITRTDITSPETTPTDRQRHAWIHR